jgi:hypothetical protein
VFVLLQRTNLQPGRIILALILHHLHSQNPFTFFLLLIIHSSVIVLYAEPLDASNTDRTPTQLANDVFGINVDETQDPVNGRSQVLRCSRGKLRYIPACATAEQSCSSNVNQSIWFKNGVLRVPIPNNVAGIASGTVKNWVEAEAQSE